MAGDDLLTRDEVLGGLPAKRAGALLFLIENRTAHLAERSRHAMEEFRTEEAARERELAFVEAFALGRDPPKRPTIQDIERFAPQWADLAPDNPRLRAAVAHLLGHKYQFTAPATPNIREALGLDGSAIQAAYQRLYREPLVTIYTPRPTLTARLRWARAAVSGWLESLPPFWTAFALTLSETVGAGILALPIALAGIGPLPGIALLILLGLVNVITIAWMAESVSRTANVRYGGYFRRLVTEYVGAAGSLLLTAALIVISVMSLLGYHIGLSTTLADATGVSVAVWMVLLFLVGLYLVSRDSLSSTVTSALAIGATNIGLILILALLGFAHLEPATLSHRQIPGVGGEPFEFAILGLIFGVVLQAYFGHSSVGNCAAIVLRRDPSAHALIWGTMAAMATAVALYVTWVLAIGGAVASDALAGETGTALVPLATVAGPAIYVFGSIFVVLAMGMGSVHKTLGLVNIVRDWLPERSQPIVLLPRGTGRLVVQPRGGADGTLSLGLTYHGLANDQPRIRLEAQAGAQQRQTDMTGPGPWHVRQMLNHLPGRLREKVDLVVTVLDANDTWARLRVASTMSMRYEGEWTAAGLDLAGILDDRETDQDWPLLRWMLRQGEVSLAEAAAWTGQDQTTTQAKLQTLVENGAVRAVGQNGQTTYRAQLARRRTHALPDQLRDAFDDPSAPRAKPHRALDWSLFRAKIRRAGERVVSEHGRQIIEYSPPFLVLLVAEWLVLTDRASFTEVLNFNGIIATPIFAGLFPCLLLVASRRKGDLAPGVVYRLLGHPLLTIGIYALFLTGILVHGLVIWQQPLQRAAALGSGVIAFSITLLAIRRGAFDRRTVVTLREDRQQAGEATATIIHDGRLTTAEMQLTYAEDTRRLHASSVPLPNFSSLHAVSVQLPRGEARDLKVWTQRILPDGETESLPARVEVIQDGSSRQVDPRLTGGAVLLPLEGEGGTGTVEITLVPPRGA